MRRGIAASRFSSSSAPATSIPGWTQALPECRVGGRRKLTIPSAMAYGARGAGSAIAPHEPLVFVVDLLSIDSGGSAAGELHDVPERLEPGRDLFAMIALDLERTVLDGPTRPAKTLEVGGDAG